MCLHSSGSAGKENVTENRKEMSSQTQEIIQQAQNHTLTDYQPPLTHMQSREI